MALKGSDSVARSAVEISAGGDVVAELGQQGLRFLDGGIGFPQGEKRLCRADGGRLDPQADAGAGEHLPRKLLAWIPLARRGDVGMGEHAVRRGPMSGEDGAGKRGACPELGLGGGGKSRPLSRICNL